jgi:hypothetical protein
MGVVELGAGYLKSTVANIGDVVCGTTTAFTVTDCSKTGPAVNIVGIATSTSNPISVVADGLAPVKLGGSLANIAQIDWRPQSGEEGREHPQTLTQ